MPAPQISPLPTPPSRSQSPETFSVDADAFLGAFPNFQAEANDQADYLDALAIAVDADATIASNSAAIAAGAANYQGDYNAGTTYQIGESVSYNGRRYVAKTVNTGIIPADGANWFLINDGDVLGPISATNNGIALYDGTTGKILKSSLNNGTAGQALLSGGNGNAPTWGNVEGGVLPFTASGSITAGQPVSLRNDGAVEVSTGFIQVETLGPNNNFSAEQTTRRNAYPIFGTSDIVIFTRTATPTPTAIHATVSGTTVTFNTTNTVPWAATYPTNDIIGCCYDPVSGKYLVAWANSSGIQAAVMTVSGTAITFGTPVTVASESLSGQSANITYDTLRQQLIVGYYGINTSSSFRIVGMVAVTISGTTLAVGHSITLLNAFVSISGAEVIYDTTVNRILYYYTNESAVQTVSGIISNSGSAFSSVLASVNINSFFGGFKNISYDPTTNRYIIAGSNNVSGAGAALVALSITASTISASSVVTATVASTTMNITSLSRSVYDAYAQRHIFVVYTSLNQVFYSVINATTSTPTFSTFVSISSSSRTPEAVYVSSQNRSVLFYYSDGGATGRAQTYQPASSGTNTQNFIGIATQSVSNGQTVSVTIAGGRNTNVSGLTTGANYFLNSLGALVTTGGVRVGEALSATSIFVEGRLNSSGTPSASTFLRGDGAFAALPAATSTLIASGTLTSAAANILVNNLNVTAYNSIILEVKLTPESSGQNLFVSFVAPGGTSANGQLYVAYMLAYSSLTSVYGANTNGGSRFVLTSSSANASSEVSAIVNVQQTNQTTTKRGFTLSSFGDTSSSEGHIRVGGGYSNAGSWGGFLIEPSSGNLTAGSYYRIYGVI